MKLEDLKIYLLNGLTLSVSFTNLELILKIILLLTSILYTFIKIYDYFKIKRNDS